MKKFWIFLILIFAVMGAIGTIGWLAYVKAWPILIGAFAVDYLAYKPFVEYLKKLLNKKKRT